MGKHISVRRGLWVQGNQERIDPVLVDEAIRAAWEKLDASQQQALQKIFSGRVRALGAAGQVELLGKLGLWLAGNPLQGVGDAGPHS